MASPETKESLSNELGSPPTSYEGNRVIDTNDYYGWTKEELIDEIRKLKKRKKYGIVWEEKR